MADSVLIPPALMGQFRAKAAAREDRPASFVAAAAIGAVWVLMAGAIFCWFGEGVRARGRPH